MTKDPSAVATLKKFYKDKDFLPAAADVMKELMGTSDRAAVITLGAFLDDALEMRLTRALRPMETDDHDYAFRFDGPLGSFSARIDMSYLLKLIEIGRKEQLHDIREMRNACAHSKRPISLDSPELANVAKRVLKDSFVAKLAPSLRVGFIAECLHIFTSLVLSEEEATQTFKSALQESFDKKLKPSDGK